MIVETFSCHELCLIVNNIWWLNLRGWNQWYFGHEAWIIESNSVAVACLYYNENYVNNPIILVDYSLFETLNNETYS